ncbi:MAG: hypothetical protein KatS3mg131_2412 [Candidatus Tectimicrobiota bacterium]|nr:MAG: hypothetical protein KatS3mg131_2412 [Candidatus Tectomicrobia bacterium]
MAITFGMPSLGHTMEKGKVVEWLKQEGEPVRKGEPLVVIETDKVITEVEAPADGVVLKLLVAPEEERPIGAPLAVLGAPGEHLSPEELAALLAKAGAPAAPAGPAPAPPPPAPAAPREAAERLKISPVARKLAEELGIDPTTLQGTGALGGALPKTTCCVLPRRPKPPRPRRRCRWPAPFPCAASAAGWPSAWRRAGTPSRG